MNRQRMTQEQRERIMATNYLDVMANRSVRDMLSKTLVEIPENIDDIFDQAVEDYFGLKVADFDDELWSVLEARSG